MFIVEGFLEWEVWRKVKASSSGELQPQKRCVTLPVRMAFKPMKQVYKRYLSFRVTFVCLFILHGKQQSLSKSSTSEPEALG